MLPDGQSTPPGAPRWVQRIGQGCGVFAALALLAVTAVALLNVVARWTGVTAPEWILPIQSEIVAWGMTAGLVTCLTAGSGLIRLDIVAFRRSARRQTQLEGARHAVCAAVFGYVAYLGFSTCLDLYLSGLPSIDIVYVPAWALALNTAVFFGLSTLVEVVRVWTLFCRSS